MKRSLVAAAAAFLLAGGAFAQAPQQPSGAQPAQGMPDLSKAGPWTRKPTNEAQTRKDVLAFFRQEDELMKKGDFEGALARIDFPIFMATDDSKGVPFAALFSREEYVREMKPMWEGMPKDVKVTHKPTVTVLSDSLVSMTDDYTMTLGGKKMSGRNMALLVKRDGQWKWKQMVEAGWGDVSQTAAAQKERGATK